MSSCAVRSFVKDIILGIGADVVVHREPVGPDGARVTAIDRPDPAAGVAEAVESVVTDAVDGTRDPVGAAIAPARLVAVLALFLAAETQAGFDIGEEALLELTGQVDLRRRDLVPSLLVLRIEGVDERIVVIGDIRPRNLGERGEVEVGRAVDPVPHSVDAQAQVFATLGPAGL
jgi:hypothetical protein